MRLRIRYHLGVAVLAYLAYLGYVYFLTDRYPSEHVVALYQSVVLVLVATYVVFENREHGHVYHPYELGMFAWLAWPIVLPYYFVKSRGLRGVLIFAGLIVMLLAEWLVAAIWYLFVPGAA